MNIPFLKDIPRSSSSLAKVVWVKHPACATAVWLADQGKRTLLVSTDPASNVGGI